MKNLLWLFLVPLIAFAKPPVISGAVQLNFYRVDISELSHVVYGEILQQDYLISPDVISNTKPVSLKLGTDKKALASVYGAFLESQGISVTLRNGVYWLDKKQDAERGEQTQVFTYRPKHRSVQLLQDMLRPFITGKIVAQQAIRKEETTPAPANPPKGSAASLIDRDHDLLMIDATKADIARINALLPQIDTPVGEVLLKAQVYEVSTSDKNGSAFGLAVSLLDGQFGFTLGSIADSGADSIRIKTPQVNAVLGALSGDSRFKVMASPTIRVKDGQNAKMAVGESVPILGSVTQDRNGNPVQSIEYKESGVILDVKPTIRDSEIDLFIKQQLSNFIPTTTGVNNSPTLIKRELQTSVSLKPDELIMLGGMNQTKQTGSRRGMSFLPSWTHTKTDDNDQTELLLVIHAQRI